MELVTWIFLGLIIVVPIGCIVALLPIAVERERRERAARESITVSRQRRRSGARGLQTHPNRSTSTERNTP